MLPPRGCTTRRCGGCGGAGGDYIPGQQCQAGCDLIRGRWLRHSDALPRKKASGHDVQALAERGGSRALLLQMLQHALQQTLQRRSRLLTGRHAGGAARCRNAT